MPSKTRKKNLSDPILHSLFEIELLDLEKLKRGQLQKIAKELGLSATLKSETLRKNIIEYIRKSKLSKTTRLDTQLPREIQDLIFEKVYDMKNPEIDEKIKIYLDHSYRIGDDNIVYNYSKIREALKIKHNIRDRELYEKLEKFRQKYIRLGVVRCYFDLRETIDYLNLEALAHLTPKSSHFDNQNRNINMVENRLLRQIKDYNYYAEILKNRFDSHFDKHYIDALNNLIKSFNKISKKRLPYLKYGTSENVTKNNTTRKIKSKRSYVKTLNRLLSPSIEYDIKFIKRKERSL